MLGFLYKIAHVHAHPAFNNLFPFAPAQEGRHDKQLGNHAHRIRFRFQLWRSSVFGLVIYFNRLPQHVIDAEDVSTFQTWLSDYVKNQCNTHNPNRRNASDAHDAAAAAEVDAHDTVIAAEEG